MVFIFIMQNFFYLMLGWKCELDMFSWDSPPILHFSSQEAWNILNRASITHKVKSLLVLVCMFKKKIYPFANKASSKVFEKGLALRLVVMEAVQITAESGLVEDHRHYHFSSLWPWTHSDMWCEFISVCDARLERRKVSGVPPVSPCPLMSLLCMSDLAHSDKSPGVNPILVIFCHILVYSHAPYPFGIQHSWMHCVQCYCPLFHFAFFFFLSNLVEGLLFHRTRNWNTCFW